MWPADQLNALAHEAGINPTVDPDELSVHEIAKGYPGTYSRLFALPPLVASLLLLAAMLVTFWVLDVAFSWLA